MKLERTRNADRQFRHRHTDSVTNASITVPNLESKSGLHSCVDKHRLSRTAQGGQLRDAKLERGFGATYSNLEVGLDTLEETPVA